MLAAGASSRFGSPKQLVTIEGVPLVRRAAMTAVAAGANPVVVVLGANARLIAPALEGLETATTVINHEWSSGLASSLRAGLAHLVTDPALDGVLVTLADQPRVNSSDLKAILDEFHAGARVVAAGYRDTMGVPAVFAREHLDDLMTLTGDSGAGHWLRSHASEVTQVPLEAAAFDMDVPSDAEGFTHGGLLFAPSSENA